MQSWIHVIEWRANTRPELTALVDDRGAAHTYAHLQILPLFHLGGFGQCLQALLTAGTSGSRRPGSC